MAARHHDKHARGSCLRWRSGAHAAVLRFGVDDTTIDLVLVGQVSATERANACWRLEAGLAGCCRCCEETDRGSARLTVVAVGLGWASEEEGR